jgi:putative beta-lysine N-acetyltransferase
MIDRIEHIRNSLVQHGKASDRVYLMKLADEPAAILPRLDDLAHAHNYSKIFAKVPASAGQAFAQAGYTLEATVPGLFRGREDGLFISRFVDASRARDQRDAAHEVVLRTAQDKSGICAERPLQPGFHWRLCDPSDAPAMAAVYRQVFESYPFPIDDPHYLRETMASHVVYFGVWRHGDLVALSSAETDPAACNAEMTDFATLPAAQGAGLGAFLLARMEETMRQHGIITAYTIARALSHGMNITFARLGYTYAGRLINNTQIAGSLESMNVWYKAL